MSYDDTKGCEQGCAVGDPAPDRAGDAARKEGSRTRKRRPFAKEWLTEAMRRRRERRTLVVRPMSVNDTHDILRMTHQMWSDGRFSGVRFSVKAIMRTMARVIEGIDFGVVAVVRGQVRGFMYAQIASLLWSDEMAAYEQALWVDHEARPLAGMIVPMMFFEFEKWAVDNDVAFAIVGASNGTESGRYGELLEEHGYKLIGWMRAKEFGHG